MTTPIKVCPRNQDENKVDKNDIKVKRRLHTIEARFVEAYEEMLKRGGTTAELAKHLNCSESYVRMMYKHHRLKPLKSSDRCWGGRRPGAGRKKGSRNRDPLMREQYGDCKTNSFEVGIFPNVRVTRNDMW